MNSIALLTDDDFSVTMLDGGLGAVAGAYSAVVPAATDLCWCSCVVCFVPDAVPSGEEVAKA
ncbi:hypothetical protein [Amycolatopsis sp. NPDC059657]|uniref:hypothetical protein n=1 Tax=Amycolatopsis sp. NPDC059657 TaxID=3346899 RepID=UPI0036703E84